jgi:predicted RNase H-like nuclease (RuvC/YqgF family)
MVNEVIIGAIAGALVLVIGKVGEIIVNIIKAKKEPDQTDLEMKDTLQREKEKNDAAIEAFTDFGKEIKEAVEGLSQKIDNMDTRIEDYRHETREINKSALRHSITEIYYKHCDEKMLDMNTKNDLCSLYEAYTSIGGNSFVHELYEEMMALQIKY